MADPPRRAADHGAVRGRADAGVTPDGGTPRRRHRRRSVRRRNARRRHALDGVDASPAAGLPGAGRPVEVECETRGDMVCKVTKYGYDLTVPEREAVTVELDVEVAAMLREQA